jgi:RNA polymerase sigma-70 factor (ECF subfamily)
MRLTSHGKRRKKLAQEAFVAYFRKKEEISTHENAIKSYLYNSVKNSVSNWSRRNKVVQKYWERTGFIEYDDLDIHRAMIETEVLTEINKIINKLPEACQAIFKLSYIEGFSNQEIADQLQLSINTIKTQKRRGLKYVQSKLNPEFFIIFMSVVLTNLPNT